jgi:hypothetical protein
MASGSRRVNSVDDVSDWPDEWSIAIYTGDSPLHLKPPTNCATPVITRRDVTDIPAAFVADPFMIRAGGVWYMFFETMNRETKKGEIGLAVSEDAMSWRYQSIVLAERYHLSYPYVFEWRNQYYMVPETYQPGRRRAPL